MGDDLKDEAAIRSPSRPLSVLIVISDLGFGGAERQVVELINHCDPAICRLHLCSLSSFVPLAKSIRQPGFAVNFVRRRFRLDFTVVPRLARLLRDVQADVIHSFLFDATIAGRLAGRLVRRLAVVGSERNANYTFKRRDFLALKATRGLEDMAIANSRAGAEFNGRLFGQPSAHYRVIHNGVDVERFQPRDASETRAKLGLKPGQPTVGMFASFKAQKNHLLWLRAARRVVERVPDLKLLFVGDELHQGGSQSTPVKEEIHQAVREWGLGERCLFLGNRQDVEQCYNACTLTALPSLFEGTPNVALESMACGVPVVISNVSDNAYIVPEGRVGHVVPLNDEVALAERVTSLLLDSGQRQAMASRARAWAASEFSCAKMAERTAAVYQEATGLVNLHGIRSN